VVSYYQKANKKIVNPRMRFLPLRTHTSDFSRNKPKKQKPLKYKIFFPTGFFLPVSPSDDFGFFRCKQYLNKIFCTFIFADKLCHFIYKIIS